MVAGRGDEGVGRGLLQFLTLQLLPCAGKGGLEPARDTGPSRALRPPPLGSSGLSLGINSLHLKGGVGVAVGRLCCAVCKTRDNKLTLEITFVSMVIEMPREASLIQGYNQPGLYCRH